ncbi:hypothetical protein K474DRAFT_1647551 [Panus rudis PR-1116 ss-1]|nr:hypothetical protein K474DRAFT_1647551 [Panus rudis PR-1116 ss-1]
MSASSISHTGSRDGTSDSLYQVRLLTALRSGDPAKIHPFLADITKDRRSSTEEGANDLGAAALHLAIRCATCDTVAFLLTHRTISPNAVYPAGSGTTPLHLAASLGRADVVSLLLEQEEVDDTLRDAQGRTCLDVAKGKETIRAIKDSRAFLNASFKSLLRAYVLSPPTEKMPEALNKILSSPRARHLDLSYLDDASGTTLLHEAAKRKDLKGVELAIRAGADVFMRDRRGRTVVDVVGKDDRVKVFLRQFANQDSTLIEPPSTEPPEHKGYLNKYTNVAKGYGTRWFVLKNGVLSYYRHQDDENVACRGSIAMKNAVLKSTPGSGGLRFEVHSTPTRGNHASQKWYIKANHPVEASRWIQALTRSIEWAKREADKDRRSVESDTLSVKPPSSRGGASPNLGGSKRGDTSVASSVADDEEAKEETDIQDEGKDTEESSLASQRTPPYDKSFELQGNSAVAQVELTAKMLSELLNDLSSSEPPSEDIKKAIQEAFHNAQSMVSEYVNMVKEREDWWKDEVKRERDRQNVWEESLRIVVQEGQALEEELRSRSRRRSRMGDSSYFTVTEFGTLKNRPSTLASPPPVQESQGEGSEGGAAVTTTATTTAAAAATENASSAVVASSTESVTSTGAKAVEQEATITRQSTMSPTGTVISHRAFPSLVSPKSFDQESMVDTDEEDEFFDAIESNSLPLTIPESLTTRQQSNIASLINSDQFIGYKHLRERLSITSDDRPPMSLWAVLKNSIGKDLTKISFPVFFNEPTSMLQRMAEDMELSECLDAAAAERDPHRRIAFVAAFAMSNYSSTIGRIAKPFNPMLSETFEYVRLDKEYRYVSEQVSHHPPISACWAESPKWHYYGEVDAQNKFMGKSFEIRPTGVAHADLLLPEEWAPNYPKYKSDLIKGRVVEHYSWKKVTTNISGFILGSPTIDHYGDMVVTNHRTKDQCVLTFKPRGWRGRDAYEISGYVMDKDGTVTYEIAGRWNSQLVARAVGTGVGHLHPDVSVHGPSSPTYSPEFILLWRNSEKPPAPFNLTPFAITLNDCPDTLKPYLAPTDCRLRPDQRAFELGKYERANELKNKQEEFQRATRKAREEGRLPPHKPRWFSATTEPDTGERVWAPSRVEDDKLEYWVEREKIWNAKQTGKEEEAHWKDVERIFIEDEP